MKRSISFKWKRKKKHTSIEAHTKLITRGWFVLCSCVLSLYSWARRLKKGTKDVKVFYIWPALMCFPYSYQKLTNCISKQVFWFLLVFFPIQCLTRFFSFPLFTLYTCGTRALRTLENDSKTAPTAFVKKKKAILSNNPRERQSSGFACRHIAKGASWIVSFNVHPLVLLKTNVHPLSQTLDYIFWKQTSLLQSVLCFHLLLLPHQLTDALAYFGKSFLPWWEGKLNPHKTRYF